MSHEPSSPVPPPREEETTVLHLQSFARGRPVPAEPSADSATQLIRKAAADTVAATPRPVVVPQAAGPLGPDELLGAVAYCYVKGVFSSADIERKMLRDPEFREALDGVVPDPATLRKFRRLNREAIQRVLELFYARLRQEQKFVRDVLPGAQPPAAVLPVSLAGGREPLAGGPRPDENTAVFVKREASERLDKATFIDGMSDF